MDGKMTINVNGVDITLEFNSGELHLLTDIISKLENTFKDEGDDNDESEN